MEKHIIFHNNDKQTTLQTTLLHSCSGFIPNGHVCAILGPSCGGKSTLLAALAGRAIPTNIPIATLLFGFGAKGKTFCYTDSNDERLAKEVSRSPFGRKPLEKRKMRGKEIPVSSQISFLDRVENDDFNIGKIMWSWIPQPSSKAPSFMSLYG